MDIDRDQLKIIIQEVLNELNSPTPMADKWEGGEIVIKPGLSTLQSKSIAIEGFFHKIVMVRNQLRVLEQKINSHAKLSDAEKVDMQQYITRSYGSLTTFNVLFKKEEDKFKGSGE